MILRPLKLIYQDWEFDVVRADQEPVYDDTGRLKYTRLTVTAIHIPPREETADVVQGRN